MRILPPPKSRDISTYHLLHVSKTRYASSELFIAPGVCYYYWYTQNDSQAASQDRHSQVSLQEIFQRFLHMVSLSQNYKLLSKFRHSCERKKNTATCMCIRRQSSKSVAATLQASISGERPAVFRVFSTAWQYLQHTAQLKGHALT